MLAGLPGSSISHKTVINSIAEGLTAFVSVTCMEPYTLSCNHSQSDLWSPLVPLLYFYFAAWSITTLQFTLGVSVVCICQWYHRAVAKHTPFWLRCLVTTRRVCVCAAGDDGVKGDQAKVVSACDRSQREVSAEFCDRFCS